MAGGEDGFETCPLWTAWKLFHRRLLHRALHHLSPLLQRSLMDWYFLLVNFHHLSACVLLLYHNALFFFFCPLPVVPQVLKLPRMRGELLPSLWPSWMISCVEPQDSSLSFRTKSHSPFWATSSLVSNTRWNIIHECVLWFIHFFVANLGWLIETDEIIQLIYVYMGSGAVWSSGWLLPQDFRWGLPWRVWSSKQAEQEHVCLCQSTKELQMLWPEIVQWTTDKPVFVFLQ